MKTIKIRLTLSKTRIYRWSALTVARWEFPALWRLRYLLCISDEFILSDDLVVVESIGEIATGLGEDIGAGSLVVKVQLVERRVMGVSISTGLDKLGLTSLVLWIFWNWIFIGKREGFSLPV